MKEYTKLQLVNISTASAITIASFLVCHSKQKGNESVDSSNMDKLPQLEHTSAHYILPLPQVKQRNMLDRGRDGHRQSTSICLVCPPVRPRLCLTLALLRQIHLPLGALGIVTG